MPPRVDFAAGISDLTADEKQYRALHREWTRNIQMTRGFDTALDGNVTLITPQFRAAYIRKRAALMSMSPEQKERLAADQWQLAEQFVEVMIVMQTARWEWNDLSSTRSVWGMTFRDDEGRIVGPVERKGIDEKPELVEALFPGVTPFTKTWLLRFPRTFADGTPLLRAHEREVAVRFSGPLGNKEARFLAR